MRNSCVLIVMQPEPGHVLPTLSLASALQAWGYRVVYLTSGSLGQHLRERGFEAESFAREDVTVQPVLSGYCNSHSGRSFWLQFGHGAQRAAFIAARVRTMVQEYEPAMLLVDHLFFRNHGLFAEAEFCGARLVHLATSLPRWDEPKDHSSIPRWVLCPAALELECFLQRYNNVGFGEPCVDWQRKEVPVDRSRLRRGAKLILYSPGTQVMMHVNADGRLRDVLRAACSMPDCDFMIATGTPQTAKEAQEELPLNVTLASHIPQLSLLPEASAFIMHGGLGSLKEAICCGVPTLVMPMVFDQPYNAMRVRELSLGMALYPDKVSALAIESCLSTLLNDARIKDGLCQMQEVFLAEAAKKPIVSMLLAQLAALS